MKEEKQNIADGLISVDLNLNQKEINESFLAMFGHTVKILLKRMFGSDVIVPAGKVRGTKSQIRSFERALMANRNYIQSYMDNGLNNPATYNSKYRLSAAVDNFQRQTGIQWPFK